MAEAALAIQPDDVKILLHLSDDGGRCTACARVISPGERYTPNKPLHDTPHEPYLKCQGA